MLFYPGEHIFGLVLFICMFCRSLFVLLYFFFWPLCGLFFFDIWILIAPLVSSNSSYLSTALSTCTYNKFECFVFLLIIPRLVSEHVPSYTVKVLLFVGTKFHGSNITGNNQWENFYFVEFLFSWFKWTTKSAKIRTPPLIMISQ